MGLNYDRLKSDKEASETTAGAFATYTDLFMTLSLIFLLMYVVSSLRSGASAIQGQIERSKMARENEDLKAQMKAYNALKDQAQQEQTQEEQKNYDQLLNHLSLLQSQAKEEKEQLRQQAQENEQKEQSLNKYQQMVRNMINSNMLAKSKLNTRENIINNKNQRINEQKQDIQEQQQELAQNEQQMKNMQSQIQEKEQQMEQNSQQIKQMQNQLSKKIGDLKKAEANHQMTKRNMENAINNLKQQTQEQIQNLEAQNQAAEGTIQSMNQKLNSTSQKLSSAQQEIQNKESELRNKDSEMKSKENSYGRKIANLSSDLQKAQDELNARKKVAENLSNNLKKAGIDANVNGKTGDVVISFGEDYFKTGSSSLNGSMQKVLNKFMPKYAEGLFKDKAMASKISSVEIIGFASPTYQGRYVDPRSLKPADKEAAKYNLKLSMKRAEAIYDHAFDTDKLQFPHQAQMRNLVKVTGRSFFSTNEIPTDIKSGISEREFCKKYDCQKSQNVIIKFNLDTEK